MDSDDEKRESPAPSDRGEQPAQRARGSRRTSPAWGSPISRLNFSILDNSTLLGFSALNYNTVLPGQFRQLPAFHTPIVTPRIDLRSWLPLAGSDVLNLTRNIDLGFSDSLAKLASGFAAQQVSLVGNLGSLISDITASIYPPNLRDIDDLWIEQVREVVMEDGIALYAVPRTAIAEALIDADGASKRREILGRRAKSISADCRDAIEACTGSAVAPYTPFAGSALDALDDGHPHAAQALAGSLIDTLLTAYFRSERYKYTPDRKGNRTNDAYGAFSVREFIAFAPMWQAYQKYFVEEGDLVPRTFSRNATAHTVSRRQFSLRNTVQALMFACSLLSFFNDEEKRTRARKRAKSAG